MSVIRSVLTYRGIRVRRWFLYLNLILKVLWSIPFILAIGYYCYVNYQQFIDLNYYLMIPVVLSLILIYPLVSFIHRFCEEMFFSYKKIIRLYLIAYFLDQHNFVYHKNGKGDSKKTKLIFPKVYLKQKKYELELYLGLQGSKFQEKFLKLGGDLERTFFMDYMDRVDEEKFTVYHMAYSAFLNRIHARDVEMLDDYKLKLSKNLNWEMMENPHLLIAGGTGAGKTVFLRSLLKGIAKDGIVYICDPKRADFVPLANLNVFKNRIFYEKEDIVATVTRVLNIMNNRYDEMRKQMELKQEREMGAFNKYGLKPVFLLIDEFNSLMSSLNGLNDYKLRQEIDDNLTQIILKGRQSGVYVILAMQKPSAEDLPTKIRSNMMHHISLGRLDDGGYHMMFGDENKDKQFRYIQRLNGKRVYGRGYSGIFGMSAQEFYSPLITKDFNFFDIFEMYEFIKNPQDNQDNFESEVDSSLDSGDVVGCVVKTFTQNEVVEVLEKKGRVVTRANIRTIFALMKDFGYEFEDMDNPKITEKEIDFIDFVVNEKEVTGKAYKSIVEQNV